MFQTFEELSSAAMAAHHKTRIALCCAQDAHALEALSLARKEGIAEGILIGDRAQTQKLLESFGDCISNYEFIDSSSPEHAVSTAAELVRAGQAGVLMKGKLQTGELMGNVLKKENGLRDSDVLSVCGSYQLPSYLNGMRPRIFSVTDPALNLRPTLEAKKAILENAVRLRHAMGDDCPKTAVIAATETVNPKMPESVDARQLKEWNASGEITGCTVEGPISLDLAMNPASAALKGYESPVAGDADLLVMPDLVSANVLAKAITEIAGGTTAGIVLGARVPIVLVSRAATASDKFNSVALAAYIAPQY